MRLMLAGMCAALVGGLAVALAAQDGGELKIGDRAPDFSLPGTDGDAHSLAALKGRWVVLAWFPKAFTGG
jgi:thioredoxin-dependent peroxiredoxin